MFKANLPIKFWGESVLTAARVINQTPSSLLQGKSPYEFLYGKRPSYEGLRTFGCLCFAHKMSRDKDNFEAQSRRCIFVGYPFGKKGWKLYDLESKDFFVSRDVVFNESTFPYVEDLVTRNVAPPAVYVPEVLDQVLESRGSASTSTTSKGVTGTDNQVVPVVGTDNPVEPVGETTTSVFPVVEEAAPEIKIEPHEPPSTQQVPEA